MLTFCMSCKQNKGHSEFKKWANDKTKACRCDACNNNPVVSKRMDESIADKKEGLSFHKPNNLYNPATPGKHPTDKERCITRNRIADIKAQQELDALDEL